MNFTRQPKRTPKRAISQVEAARILNVTRFHLNKVLRGHRISKSLMSRWNKLQAEAGK